MEVERSQILANFQACTNIEDIAIALSILEQTEWDLQTAVQLVLANESGFTTDNASASDLHIQGQGFDVTGRFDPPSMQDHAREIIDEYGVSRRLLHFTANYKDRVVQVQVPDAQTVNELKNKLAAELNIDESDFSMNWQDNRIEAENDRCLRELHLPRENTLHLSPNAMIIDDEDSEITAIPVMETNPDDDNFNRSISDNLQLDFNLSIDVIKRDSTRDHFDITMHGSSSVYEAKQRIEGLSGIPVNSQRWEGWPANTSNDLTIAACNISHPTHRFTVTSSIPTISLVESDDSDIDEDDHLDILDFDSQPSSSSNRNRHLIPNDIVEINDALRHFNEEFARRYGSVTRPVFYEGSLEAAVNDALQCSPRDRRLLAIYLHHDSSIASNVFCSQVLCSETIVNYLSANFLLWGWDLTLPNNRKRFQSMCERVLGRGAGDYVRRLNEDSLPVLIIVSKVRGSLEILNTSSSTVTAEELMTTLLGADDLFQEQKQQDVREEDERQAREEMKRMQDAEYEASLAADRQKEEQKRREEAEKEAELHKQRQEAEFQEALKQSLAETIPDEPAADSTETMARLRIRCPEGETISRRFLGVTKLQVLLNYIVSKGYSQDEYKVLTTFPRRDLSQEDTGRTLEELKLCPQETLILEAK